LRQPRLQIIPIEAATAADALVEFEAEQPTAVLLDINLPAGCGLDILREIKHCIERAMLPEQSENLSTLKSETGSSGSLFKLPAAGINLEQVELDLVRQAIDRSNGNQTRAAELLGISRDQLRYRLKKLEAELVEVK
jgi:DNA-binding NtrC family response regulator